MFVFPIILSFIAGALLVIFHFVRNYFRTEKYLVRWVDLSSYRKIGYQQVHNKMADNIFQDVIFLKFI